jgi:outer membrane receptor for ferrienterochelin and colicin
MTRRFLISPLARASVLSLTVLSLTHAAMLSHADEPDEASSENSTIIYPASFFQPYNPVSVNDMIDRIPGVSIGRNNSGRGLGSGGNLLINGQRLAGKDNSPRDQLNRIAAREVERIEIIRGTSGELAVRGSGQVINIVLQEARTRSSTSVEINSDLHRDGTLQPGASVSHSLQSGNFTALVNLQADPQYNHNRQLENIYDPGLNPIELMRESNIRDRVNYRTSATVGYRLDQHRMQLNALYGMSDHPVDVSRQYTRLQPDGSQSLRGEREHADFTQHNWELGGDYEFTLSGGERLLFLFIVNDETNNNIRERYQIDQPLASSDERKSLFVKSNNRTRERIAQSTYSWGLSETQDMQLGLEHAQTILDSSLLIGRASGTAEPSPAFGGLRPALGISNIGSTVQEMRYEGFAVHNWTLNDRMTLESSLVYETSEISQTGNTSKSREFNFWRPSVDYRFNITSALQLRATVGKEVQQLSFANFSATANNSDISRDADAGNPDLVPTQEVRYELALQYRLPDDAGVLTSRFFMREIADHIGRVDATTNPAQPISAAGNIGDAKRWGVYLDGSTRLGAVGLPDAIVSSSLYLFDSEVVNPILGTTERISGRGRAGLGFRHDLTDWNFNYGFDYNHPFSGGHRQIEIASIDRFDMSPSMNMFVSTVLFEDVTFRLEANNALASENCRERIRYQGTSASGNIRQIDNSCFGSGRKVALKVRTTF